MSLCVESKQEILVTLSVQKMKEFFSISANLHKLAFRLLQSVNLATKLKPDLNGFTYLSFITFFTTLSTACIILRK